MDFEKVITQLREAAIHVNVAVAEPTVASLAALEELGVQARAKATVHVDERTGMASASVIVLSIEQGEVIVRDLQQAYRALHDILRRNGG